MARIRAKETTIQEDGAATTIDVVLPEHATNDLLVIFISRDNNREDFNTPSGWTQAASVGYGSSSLTANAIRAAVYWKVAASANETNPTFTIVNADEMLATAISIEGADTNTPIDMTPTTGTDASTPSISIPSVTTATNNALVFHFAATDGNVADHPPASWITVDIVSLTNALGHTVITTVQATAGATDAATMYSSVGATDETAIISLAVRDGSSGAKVQPYPLLNCISTIDALRAVGTSSPSNLFSTVITDYSKLWKFNQNPTLYDPTSCWQVTAVGPVYTSMLTAATNDTQGDVIPFPASEATGDYFTVGYSSPWSGMLVDRTGATLGVGGVGAIEYWNGSAWTAPSEVFDGTSSTGSTGAFCVGAITGGQFIKWKIPSNWATLALNGETADYKIRVRCSTVYTTNPTMTRIKIFTDAIPRFAVSSNSNTVANAGLNFNENAVCLYSRYNATNFREFVTHLLDPQSTQNWSSGLVAFCYGFGGGAYLKGSGTKALGGIQFGIHDRTNDRLLTWCVGSSDSVDSGATDLQTAVIQPSQSTDTSWFKSATPPSVSDVDSFLFAIMNNGAGNRATFVTRMIQIPGTIQVCGGGSGYPITWERLLEAMSFYEFPIINKSSGVCIAPIQFGGTKAVYVDASIFAWQFPAQATQASDYTKCHVDDGYLGVVIDARSGDTVKLTSGTIVGLSKIRFEMLNTCSASATYSFNGLTIVNANVTMRPVKTFSAMQFINCTTFAQNETDFSLCTFKGSTITCDKLAGFSKCAFTCAAEHALVLGASQIGTHVFAGNTFSGYGADGSSTAAIYNNSGGLVTIQLSSGDAVPTVKNGAGASTVISLSASYTVNNIVSGSRILIRRTDTQDVLVNETVSGTSKVYTYNYTADFPIEVVLRKASSAPQYQEWRTTTTLTSTSASVTANQVLD